MTLSLQLDIKKYLLAAVMAGAPISTCIAAEPDGQKLPFGFHANVVHEGLSRGTRHLATHGKEIYISTRTERSTTAPFGVIAVRLGADHKAPEMQRFATVDNGTSIRYYMEALYAVSHSTLYQFAFKSGELVPAAPPQVIVSEMPNTGHTNVGVAFDDSGHLLMSVSGEDNICADPNVPKGHRLVGLNPCPSLNGREGQWRFGAEKLGQKFPQDGEQIATGVRDMMALAWSKDIPSLYGVMQDRNGPARMFGETVSATDDADSIAEEMHRIDKGADLGWPYTYFDIALNERITAPEYGVDGKTVAKGNYSAPVVAFAAHQSPLDLLFYDGHQFPKEHRRGAFVVLQGGSGARLPQGHYGYDIVLAPFNRHGKPGQPEFSRMGSQALSPSIATPKKRSAVRAVPRSVPMVRST